MAIRNEAATKRIDAILQAIAARLDLEIPTIPSVRNNAILQETLRLEWSADVLEQVDRATGGTGPVDPDADKPEDLASLKRADLNTLAAELGIENPEKLKNKPAVIEAIEQARAESENPDADASTEESDSESSEVGEVNPDADESDPNAGKSEQPDDAPDPES
jgi:hypothetical protein